MAVFEAAEVTAAPVYDIDQFVADPHVIEREIIVDLPDDELGRVAMHNVVPRLSGTPGRLRRPAPSLGQDAAEILGRIGIDAAELAQLRQDRVVGVEPKPAKETAR
jgi:crotonobetainyl-CoA:carnitine CoA-transferase CaiB-like acyl-CoA transferase